MASLLKVVKCELIDESLDDDDSDYEPTDSFEDELVALQIFHLFLFDLMYFIENNYIIFISASKPG